MPSDKEYSHPFPCQLVGERVGEAVTGGDPVAAFVPF